MNYIEYRKKDIEKKTAEMHIYPVDILITGITGAGKSSTLNSIFEQNIAKVGTGVNPETMDINEHKLSKLTRFWDTPGLGDGIEKDKIHSKKIIDFLYKTYEKNNIRYGFIDLILVIIDGSSRDMGTTYNLLNKIIIPNISKDRILIAINQCDMAMKGHHWDSINNKPDKTLTEFLDEKAYSIQKRIKESTNINVKLPIYYSAYYKYNIHKLMDLIIDNIPTQRRTIKI